MGFVWRRAREMESEREEKIGLINVWRNTNTSNMSQLAEMSFSGLCRRDFERKIRRKKPARELHKFSVLAILEAGASRLHTQKLSFIIFGQCLKAHGEKVVYEMLVLWNSMQRLRDAFCRRKIHLLMAEAARRTAKLFMRSLRWFFCRVLEDKKSWLKFSNDSDFF